MWYIQIISFQIAIITKRMINVLSMDTFMMNNDLLPFIATGI